MTLTITLPQEIEARLQEAAASEGIAEEEYVLETLEERLRVERGKPENLLAAKRREFTSLPFFGMWSDREDMINGAEWVRQERKQWHRRAQRQD